MKGRLPPNQAKPRERDETIRVDSDPVAFVPTVESSWPPRVCIYDAKNDGSYWYRGIGFTAKINE